MILLTDVQTCTEKLASLNRRKVESRSSVGKAASQDLTDDQIKKKKKKTQCSSEYLKSVKYLPIPCEMSPQGRDESDR